MLDSPGTLEKLNCQRGPDIVNGFEDYVAQVTGGISGTGKATTIWMDRSLYPGESRVQAGRDIVRSTLMF